MKNLKLNKFTFLIGIVSMLFLSSCTHHQDTRINAEVEEEGDGEKYKISWEATYATQAIGGLKYHQYDRIEFVLPNGTVLPLSYYGNSTSGEIYLSASQVKAAGRLTLNCYDGSSLHYDHIEIRALVAPTVISSTPLGLSLTDVTGEDNHVGNDVTVTEGQTVVFTITETGEDAATTATVTPIGGVAEVLTLTNYEGTYSWAVPSGATSGILKFSVTNTGANPTSVDLDVSITINAPATMETATISGGEPWYHWNDAGDQWMGNVFDIDGGNLYTYTTASAGVGVDAEFYIYEDESSTPGSGLFTVSSPKYTDYSNSPNPAYHSLDFGITNSTQFMAATQADYDNATATSIQAISSSGSSTSVTIGTPDVCQAFICSNGMKGFIKVFAAEGYSSDIMTGNNMPGYITLEVKYVK